VNSLEAELSPLEIARAAEQIEQARGSLTQAKGQLAYAQSQLEATLIRAPVNGTILEPHRGKGELITAQFPVARKAASRFGGCARRPQMTCKSNSTSARMNSRVGLEAKGIVSVAAFRLAK